MNNLRLEVEYGDFEITLYGKDGKLLIEVWSDKGSAERVDSLRDIDVSLVKGGISGVIGPDVIINLGDTLEKIRQEALDIADPNSIMEDEGPLSLEEDNDI